MPTPLPWEPQELKEAGVLGAHGLQGREGSPSHSLTGHMCQESPSEGEPSPAQRAACLYRVQARSGYRSSDLYF